MTTDTPVARWQARMGWTDRHAAQMLGMTQGSYSAIKTGKTPANMRTLLACAALESGSAPIA